MQGFGNNTLVVRKVERTDVGHYKCVASNYLGQVSSEAMVNVNGNGSSTARSAYDVRVWPPYKNWHLFLAPPVIISASHDITAKTGATVELQCLVEGYPKPVVTWFKDGRSITPGPRISFHSESKPSDGQQKQRDCDYVFDNVMFLFFHYKERRCVWIAWKTATTACSRVWLKIWRDPPRATSK